MAPATPVDPATPSSPVEAVRGSAEANGAPVLSKRAAKKSKKLEKKLTAEEEEEKNIAASIDHPYLSFLHKRIRLYKKKQEKIKALELAQANEGKKLNDQQEELVASRPLVDKMIAEFESLRGQFIEVFVSEQKQKEAAAEHEKQPEEPEKTSAAIEQTQNTAIEQPKIDTVIPSEPFGHVKDLLRTLHAVTLHQALGKEVPLVLDYFSKVLLGKTRLPAEVAFDANLAESLEEATRYLTRSDQIVAQHYTYRDLRAMVESLGVEPVSTEELPQINFFTDSVLEPEPATEDKVNGHETVPESIDSPATSPSVVDVPEPPPVSAVPAPPKSFAAAAASRTNVAPSNRVDSTITANPADDDKEAVTTDEKPRRRPSSRPKSRVGNSSTTSPRNDDEIIEGKNGDGSKPRRSRPPRQNDENSPSNAVKRTPSTGAKAGEGRPRQPRKTAESVKA